MKCVVCDRDAARVEQHTAGGAVWFRLWCVACNTFGAWQRSYRAAEKVFTDKKFSREQDRPRG